MTFRVAAVHVPNDEPTHLRIPGFDLAAELWTEPAGEVEDHFIGRGHPFISTDRVRFLRWLGGDSLGDPVALDSVPAHVFSEVMRDVDLMVGVASIGNDPTWIDGGAGAAPPGGWRAETANDYWTRHSLAELDVAGESRKAFLSELIPSLAIADRCTLNGRFFEVRGRLSSYRIHLGSGNILMEGDRYLCIVPGSTRKDALDVFLPFEGDRMLSIILSKALMLAADDKITDPAIVSQLRASSGPRPRQPERAAQCRTARPSRWTTAADLLRLRFDEGVRAHMPQAKRKMHLGVFVLGTGNHSAGWRYDGAFTSNASWPVMQTIAKTAERGKFDLFFISDAVSMDTGDHPSFISRFEPMTLLGALSTVTTHIGLGATVSTSFSQPYNVARAFASLDHLSSGRAAWNVVTSTSDKSARNFNQDKLADHDLRYEIATEFVDVVRGLWDTWDDDALVVDKATGMFVDPAKVRELNHQGQYFTVRGPINIERSPQGHPLIIQAGGSPPGQELSARSADLVFSVVNGDPAGAKAAYDGLKARVVKHGRSPADLPILPGVMPIIAETDEQAREQLARLQSWLTSKNALTLVSQRLGHDISGYPLDGPVPEFPTTQVSQGFAAALFDMARRENMTLRDLYNITAAARGHWVVCGSPKRIADVFEDWFTAGRADGFVIMPAYFPGPFDDFVNLVVPELQRRGLFRTDYAGSTLRDHLGLARPQPRIAARQKTTA